MNELFYDIRFGIKIMESLACIIGFLCWARLKPSFWKLFPIYLLIIVCCEFTGWYITKNKIADTRYFYQFFVIPLEFLFFYFLHFNLQQSKFQKMALFFGAIYFLSVIIEFVSIKNSKLIWLSSSYTIGNIFLVVLSITYFLSLHKKVETITYTKLPFYWVNIGVLLFYLGTMPYYTVYKTFFPINGNLFIVLAWASVILNYIMYTTFIISFLCHPKR